MDSKPVIQMPIGDRSSATGSGGIRLRQSANRPPLFAMLFPVLDRVGHGFEIIAVDHGGEDGSMRALCAVNAEQLGGNQSRGQ